MRVDFADGIKNDTDLEDSNSNDNGHDANHIISNYQLSNDNLEYHIRATTNSQRGYYGAKGIGNIMNFDAYTIWCLDLDWLVCNHKGLTNTNAEFPIDSKEIYGDSLDIITYLPYIVSAWTYEHLTIIKVHKQGQPDIEWVCHLNNVSQSNLDCFEKIDFDSDNTTAMAMGIWAACGQGKSVVVNQYFPDANDNVFNIDIILIYCNIYQEVEWQR